MKTHYQNVIFLRQKKAASSLTLPSQFSDGNPGGLILRYHGVRNTRSFSFCNSSSVTSCNNPKY